MDDLITVCSKCLCASCWQWIFACDNAVNAGTVQKTRGELLALNLENPDYLLTDDELARGVRPGEQEAHHA